MGCSELTSHCVKANSSDLNKSTEDNNEEGWGVGDEKEVQRGQSGRIEKVAPKSSIIVETKCVGEKKKQSSERQ